MSDKPASRGPRILLILAAVLFALNAAGWLAGRLLGGEVSGPPSSSFTTSPEGLAAYSDLLQRHGHTVKRMRDDPASATLDPATTVVVLDPIAIGLNDATSLRAFVRRGGRLVAGGANPRWVRHLLDRPPSWTPHGVRRAGILAPAAEVAGVGEIAGTGVGSWSSTGEALGVAGRGRFTLAAVAAEGAGRMVLLADASPLRNGALGYADNAAFGLALAGDTSRPVVFAESVHGYGRAEGMAAIPARWRWAAIVATLAAALWMASRARRPGPSEDVARALPPARAAFAEALGASLGRTRDRAGASAPVRDEVLRRLRARAGLGPEATPQDLERAAQAAGLRPDETRAALGEVTDDASLLALGRALVRSGGFGGGAADPRRRTGP